MSEFPPTWCITCPELGRQALTQEHLQGAGITATFFHGVHGETFGLDTTNTNRHSVNKIDPRTVGNILSHWCLWNVLLHQPGEEFLVLEDDARFPRNFLTRYRLHREALPADWDFCFAGWVDRIDNKGQVQVSDLVSRVDWTFATHAYLVRKSALPTLLRTNRKVYVAIDVALGERSLPHLRTYAFTPAIVKQGSYEGVWARSLEGRDDDTLFAQVLRGEVFLPADPGESEQQRRMLLRWHEPRWGSAVVGASQDGIEGLCEMHREIRMAGGALGRVAEIGCHAGVSTQVHCAFAKTVLCVDLWPDPAPFERFLSRNLKNAEVLKKSSIEAARDVPDESLDLVYIDADHDTRSVLEDLEAWVPKVKSGGWITGHDYWEQGVFRAVMLRLGKPQRVYRDTSWLFRKGA